MDQGFPKGGVGGSDVWEKFPNNIVFFFDGVPYITRIYDGLSVGSSLGKREMRALGGENYSQIQGWALLTRNFTLVLLLQSI